MNRWRNFLQTHWPEILLKSFGLVFSGVLLSFAHPLRIGSFTRNPSWISLFIASMGLGLFLTLAQKSHKAKRRFLHAFLTGFVFYTLTLFWIAPALKEYGELNLFISVAGMILLASYCSLFFGAWAALVGLPLIRKQAIFIKVFLWASLWASLEALRQVFLTGFPWGELGF